MGKIVGMDGRRIVEDDEPSADIDDGGDSSLDADLEEEEMTELEVAEALFAPARAARTSW